MITRLLELGFYYSRFRELETIAPVCFRKPTGLVAYRTLSAFRERKLESEESAALQKYKRRERTFVSAVQLDLDMEGFTYQKWEGTQHCKRGDWLVNNHGDTYTIDADTFVRTYRIVSPGQYEKNASVWAEQATESGTIQTKEGSTAYSAGDYLVFTDLDRKDGYAMKESKFRDLYECVD